MFVGELIHGLNIRPAAAGAAALRSNGGGKGGGGVRICDITEDSRTAMPGSLFVARRGEHVDGRKFVDQAIAAGAVAILTDDPDLRVTPPHQYRGEPPVSVLVADDLEAAAAALAERFYGRPSDKLAMLGVTGTNGKTTITFLIHQLLNAIGVRTGLIGTVQVDDGREVAPATHTTPPAIELSRTLATMVESGCRAAVMEVSSHALHQRRVGAMSFDAAVFTNLTGDHLDYHKTMDAYGDAKAMLFAQLRPGGAAIVNADDPWHERMAKACPPGARLLRCTMTGDPARALHDPGLCAAVIRESGPRHSRIALFGPWATVEVTSRLVGRHNAMNLLQAVAVLHAAAGKLGVLDHLEPTGLARLLSGIAPPPGRLEPAGSDRDKIAVYVDYAHSDDALRNVLTTIRETMRGAGSAASTFAEPKVGGAGGPLLHLVFGCGGDRDKTKRPRMGEIAAQMADRVVVTSDNPRTERPSAIIGEIMAGVPADLRSKVTAIEDRERAIHAAILGAAPGDVVLIAGKGHEDYQILPDGRGGTVTRPFDDRLVARAALAARPDAPSQPQAASRSSRRSSTANPAMKPRPARTESP